MQRVLDPAQIEAYATQRAIPRIRLPDPTTLFSNRARRLRKLSEGHAVGDYLRLMAVLGDAQQTALEQLELGPPREPGAFDGMPLLQAAGSERDGRWRGVLLQLAATVGDAHGFPDTVAAVCRWIQQAEAPVLDEQANLLLAAEVHGVDPQAAPFIMAALQVYWVRMVGSLSLDTVATHVGRFDVPGLCPVCGTLPVASIVRADKAYQGYRYLQCALCATEWHFVRIKCSQCLSTEGIHYQSIEGGPTAIRAEACDACRTYRKICYQEQDMDVEPLADDLGSLALDLLLSEAGFHRASGNPLLFT
jgi:FdhE protein